MANCSDWILNYPKKTPARCWKCLTSPLLSNTLTISRIFQELRTNCVGNGGLIVIERGHLRSRRKLLRNFATGIALVTSIATVIPARATGMNWTRKRRQHVFVLDPYASPVGATCWKCIACRKHAEHKRFATYAAADRNRAHPNCRCGIRSVEVSKSEFHALFGLVFGKGVHTGAIDLRANRVQKLAARS